MNISKEAEASAAVSSMFPGFRFNPTDEELIVFYLRKKVEGSQQRVELISEVDLCKHEPWDLPAMSAVKSEHEWFFFSPRGKKYPNGSQSRRATEGGYWKATGKERGVKSGAEVIGTKRTLVFHVGRAPKGERTEWIMHEYCLAGNLHDSLVICRLRKKNDATAATTTTSISDIASASTDGSLMPADKKTADCCSKICTSDESHSVDQMINSHPPNRHRSPINPDTTPNAGNEDDCFADVLKHDIVELDESSVRARALQLATGQPGHPLIVPWMSGAQGTANRRIRLKRVRGVPAGEFSGENCVSKESERKIAVRLGRKTNQLYVVMMMTGLVAMALIFSGCSRQGFSCAPAALLF